jgi:hypothetical protein
MNKSILIISKGNLINNGTAGHTVMCGLVQAALNKGMIVIYLGLNHENYDYINDENYVFNKSINLKKYEIKFKMKITKNFKQLYDESINSEINPVSLEFLSELKLDAILAFDSLPISLMRNIHAKTKIAIIGDPVAKRLYYFSNSTNLIYLLKLIIIHLYENIYYYELSKRYILSMFGTKHVKSLQGFVRGNVIDLRPFINNNFDSNKLKNTSILKIYFGGTLRSTASKMSLNLLLNNVYPALEKEYGNKDFELRIIGEYDDNFKKLADNYKQIKILGRVKNFENELANGDVFLLPINYPVGVRTRICSALSAGLICIVHSSILINMPELLNCKAIKIADTTDDILKSLKILPKGDDLIKIKKEAILFFNKNYEANMSTKKLLDLI